MATIRITDESLCVAVRGACSVWDFCKEENKDEVLKKAQTSLDADLKMYQEYATKYDNQPDAEEDRKTYWAERYEAEKDKKYEVIKFGDFLKAERETMLAGPIEEITEDKFFERLEVLPPLHWCTVEGVEMFCIMEMISGSYTEQCAKANGKFYSKTVDSRDKSTWILELLKNNHEIKPLEN